MVHMVQVRSEFSACLKRLGLTEATYKNITGIENQAISNFARNKAMPSSAIFAYFYAIEEAIQKSVIEMTSLIQAAEKKRKYFDDIFTFIIPKGLANDVKFLYDNDGMALNYILPAYIGALKNSLGLRNVRFVWGDDFLNQHFFDAYYQDNKSIRGGYLYICKFMENFNKDVYWNEQNIEIDTTKINRDSDLWNHVVNTLENLEYSELFDVFSTPTPYSESVGQNVTQFAIQRLEIELPNILIRLIERSTFTTGHEDSEHNFDRDFDIKVVDYRYPYSIIPITFNEDETDVNLSKTIKEVLIGRYGRCYSILNAMKCNKSYFNNANFYVGY